MHLDQSNLEWVVQVDGKNRNLSFFRKDGQWTRYDQIWQHLLYMHGCTTMECFFCLHPHAPKHWFIERKPWRDNHDAPKLACMACAEMFMFFWSGERRKTSNSSLNLILETHHFTTIDEVLFSGTYLLNPTIPWKEHISLGIPNPLTNDSEALNCWAGA